MNTLTPLSPTYWSKAMQAKLYKENVFRNIASFREEATLTDGQEVDRPYRTALTTEKIARGTALTPQDLSSASDKLTVDKWYGGLFYVDRIDKIQNKYDAARAYAQDIAEALNNDIDGECLFHGTEGSGITTTVDYNDVDSAQTAGLALPASPTNIYKVFTIAGRKLTKANVPMADRVAVISPEAQQFLIEYFGGKDSALGDKTSEAGNVGRAFGFEIFVSNNLTGSARWTPVDKPTDDATVTIGGVVFTFDDTLDAGVAGCVHTDSSVANTVTNLAQLINAGGVGTALNSVSVSVANQRIVKNMFAVATATYITVYHKGTANISVATSEALDLWSHKKQHMYFAQRRSTDLVIQLRPDVEMASTVSAGKSGMNVLVSSLFGVDTPYERKSRIVDVQIDSSTF
jgi:hypothetical protein